MNLLMTRQYHRKGTMNGKVIREPQEPISYLNQETRWYQPQIIRSWRYLPCDLSMLTEVYLLTLIHLQVNYLACKYSWKRIFYVIYGQSVPFPWTQTVLVFPTLYQKNSLSFIFPHDWLKRKLDVRHTCLQDFEICSKPIMCSERISEVCNVVKYLLSHL